MAKTQTQKKNIIAQGIDFFNESVDEMKKVHPPTRQETIQVTFLVLVLVMFFGLFLGLTDLVVGWLMGRIL